MSETTKGNKKRMLDDWDDIHKEADKAGDSVSFPKKLIDKKQITTDEEGDALLDYEEKRQKARQKVYAKHGDDGGLMDRSQRDLWKQEEEDERRKSARFSNLKKLLRGE